MDLRFFEIYRNPDYLWLLAEGAFLSAWVTIAAGAGGFAIAILLSVARHAKIPILAQIAAIWTEVIRNTPLIVQLFFIAFGLPLLFGYQWPFWGHALLALSINFSGYFSEILRSGYASVNEGQIEAARALGLGPVLRFRKIVLPQAVAKVFPSLNAQFIFLFLTTGVISEIGVEDLTHAGVFIDSRSFRSFEVFITLTLIYMAMSVGFKTALTLAQRHFFHWQVAR